MILPGFGFSARHYETGVNLTIVPMRGESRDGRGLSGYILQATGIATTSDRVALVGFLYQPFGGYLGDFRQFGGYMLPTSVEGGNHFGTNVCFNIAD